MADGKPFNLHDERFPYVHAGVDDPFISVRAKVGQVVTPQVTAGYHSRGPVGFGRVTGRDEETEEHVTTFCVRICRCMTGVVVFVVSMQSLRRSAWGNVKGDRDGQ